MTYKYGYSTNVFKDIFKDYEQFKSIYSETPLFNVGGVWSGPSATTFQILYNNFAGSHVSSSDESFIRRFENVLFEHYERFEYDIKVKKEARGDIDWAKDSENISNTAIAPNDEGDTDSEMISSIDQQVKNIQLVGKSSELYRKRDHNKAYSIKTFLNYFKPLFIQIFDPVYTPVWVSDDSGYLIEGEE